MPPNRATFPTWQELYGRRPAIEDVRQILHGLNQLKTVLLLSQISIHLALDRFHNKARQSQDLQAFLVSNFISDELLAKLKERYGPERTDVRRCFHPWQVLTLLKWAIVECPSSGGVNPDENQEAKYNLGRALVMTNDLLVTKGSRKAIDKHRPSEKRRILALQLQLGSAFEVNNPPSIRTSIVRSEIMFGEIARQRNLPLDVNTIFADRTGLPLNGYVDMVFAILIYYLTQSHKELIEDSRKVLLNPDTFFRIVPQEDVKKFLEMEMGSIEEAATQLKRLSPLKPQHDFIAFRKKPLLQLAEKSALCINTGFLQEKLESGLFWSIFNSLSTNEERWSLFSAWGKLFEEYISYLFVEPFEGKNESYFAFPRFTDNDDEAFDGVVVAGPTWFVMEYKGGFLKAEAKYAESEDALIDDLRLKFGTDRRAGVGQLARKIGQVFAAKDSTRRTLRGLDSSKAAVIVPVMVVQEPFISSPITSTYLCGEFRSAIRRESLLRRVSCTGLQILDVGDIEAIRSYIRSGHSTFADPVMGRARLGDKAPDFHDYLAQYFKAKNLKPLADIDFVVRAGAIFDRISNRFFGHPYTPDTPGEKESV
jgi:hypothetical protein